MLLLDFYEVKDSLTLASICSFSLSEKMGEETGKGFEQILGEIIKNLTRSNKSLPSHGLIFYIDTVPKVFIVQK